MHGVGDRRRRGQGLTKEGPARWTDDPPDARLRALLAGLAALALATASQAAGGGNPRLLYTLHCSGCHLPDGSGAPARGIPSMRGSVGNFLRLPEGRALLVQVPGVMNTPLDDEQVAKLMNWLLRDMAGPSMPPDAPPYTASEVKSLRRTRPADMAATPGPAGGPAGRDGLSGRGSLAVRRR